MGYMQNHQLHFGRKFYQDKKTGYWISTTEPRIRAHCWVWKNIHGIIPPGYHIHHRDENRSNNHIENLELIHGKRHISFHSSKPEHKERARKWADQIRPLTKEWHKSEEGRAWHKRHAKKTGFGTWEEKEYKCKNCNALYKSSQHEKCSKFCSNKCKSAYRRKSGRDDEKRICMKCHQCFQVNKYSKAKYCSRRCSKLKS